MNALPVIVRELRAEARHPFTYWLRVLGAGAVVGMAIFYGLANGLRPDGGAELFTHLHGTLHFAIWLLVPLLAADCISRERREGTLGLLFLTPLKARDIIVAKSLVHGLRAATLLIAVLPVIALPALMGGVSWQQGLASLFLNASALCLALGAGLLASAANKSWIRSLVMSYCFAFVFALMFCKVLMAMFSLGLGQGASFAFQHGFQLAIGINPEFFTYGYYYRSGMMFNAPASLTKLFQAVSLAAGYTFLASVVGLVLMILFAALLTAQSWQERPPHPLQIWFRQRLCTPVIMLDVLKRWMKRKLERNPIGWLEQRTWSGRLVIWGWFAVMISIYSQMLTNSNFLTRSFGSIHTGMGWMLLASMAVNASTSFRRERENRVLELLLVSPLSEGSIILGRLRGLWGQLLPSMGLLLCGWFYLSVVLDQFGRNVGAMMNIAASFVALPVIGLYFSLVCRNFLVALAWTVLIGMVLPSVAALPLRALFSPIRGVVSPDFSTASLILLKLGIAAFLWSQLHRCLVQRRFAMEST